MTDVHVAWVFAHSPYKGAARIVHVALAHHANARRYVQRAQSDLAADASLDLGHLRRTVRAILDDGLAEVINQPSGRTPATLRLILDLDACARVGARATSRALDPVDRAPTRALDPAETETPPLIAITKQDTPPNPPSGGKKRKPKPSPREPEAREVVSRVWENRNPRPALRFFQLIRVGVALLEAGHPAAAVEAAMMAVPTITIKTCEYWLNSVPTSTEPEWDRDTPGGRITL